MADYGLSDSAASRRRLENDCETIDELGESPVSTECLSVPKGRAAREDLLYPGIERLV
jgi:hypothetical protein